MKLVDHKNNEIKSQVYLGCPGTKTFIRYVKNKIIHHYPIASSDTRGVEVIYCIPTSLLQGKMIRVLPMKVSE